MTRDVVIARLTAGDKLHMQLVDGRRIWWFENPRAEVADAVATKLQESGELSELGDSLFGLAGNSQSWGG